ncbi:MAG: WD40 repeat domain-containing protein [Kofleriaceae bacterium]
MKLLLDVDRWDRAGEVAQNAAIAEVHVDGFTHVRMQRFTGVQHRVSIEPCWRCNYAETLDSDCSVCDNAREIEYPAESATLSHRVAIFHHLATGDEHVLVPGRLDIAPCLVARAPNPSKDPPLGLRALTPAEARHAVIRGGAYDLAFESAAWSDDNDHPFGLGGRGARFAASIPGADRAQADAFHELCTELGPIQPGSVPGALVRIGHGTADPPNGPSALAFSRDGRWLATGHTREARVWDAATGLHISRIPLAAGEETQSIAFSHDHVHVVIATDQRIVSCEVASGDPVTLGAMRLPAEYGTKRLAAWLPDGRILAAEANSRDAYLVLVDPQTTHEIAMRHWESEPAGWVTMAISFEGTRAAISQLHEGALAIWNTETLEVERHIAIASAVRDLALANHDLVFTTTSEGVRVYTADGSHEISDDGGRRLACSPDGRTLACSNVGLELRDLITQQITKLAHAHAPVAFSPDGTRLAAYAGNHELVAIWSVRSS